MKNNLPESLVVPGHPDFVLLAELSDEILQRAGGVDSLTKEFPPMLRECIDDVIQTPRTGRRSYGELEKTEKTYIGTRVEIMLRSHLRLQKGMLDTVIKGHDVDIKHTMGSNWMIPREAFDHPCILVAADEEKSLCYLGIFVAKQAYLTRGANRDAKKTVSADGFRHIYWLLNATHYPPNFWRLVPNSTIELIFGGTSGNMRVLTLFQELQDVVITREVIDSVAKQKDFTRRLRKDSGKGTRDKLAAQNILILSGAYDSPLIDALGLPECGRSEFISHRISSPEEQNIARSLGQKI